MTSIEDDELHFPADDWSVEEEENFDEDCEFDWDDEKGENW